MSSDFRAFWAYLSPPDEKSFSADAVGLQGIRGNSAYRAVKYLVDG